MSGASHISQVSAAASQPSIASSVVSYLLLAFAFSWITLVSSIKLGLAEPYLNFGIAGPALAALVCSRRGTSGPHSRFRRSFWFVVLLLFGWTILLLRYFWPLAAGAAFQLHPWLLVPAAPPAWILSGFVSADDGVRGLLRRLIHPPAKSSAVAFLFFPVLIGIPSVIAAFFHLPLLQPASQGSLPLDLAASLIFFLYNLFFVGTLEEPGWRGFLLDRIQQKFSPLTASLLVWFPWAVWHAPLDYYRPVRFTLVSYLLLRVVFLIPITIILTWFYNRSSRSIQSTAIFHACMNTFPFVAPCFQPAWGLIFAFAIYAVVSSRMWSRLQPSS